MAILPSASVQIDETSSAPAINSGYAVVMAPVLTSADSTPRVFSSVSALLSQYGYAPGVDYCALHFDGSRKPVIFVGLPISTAGTVTQPNAVGVTGTSKVSIAVATGGSMEETQGSITVKNGGTIGTDQITLSLSLDGGTSTQNVNLSTGTSYTIPNVGLVLTFGAGTLIAGDVFSWVSSAPMFGSTALTLARTNLAAQQLGSRSWVVVGDLPNSTFAGYLVTETGNYETANQRFTYARGQVQDRLPLAGKSGVSVRGVGAPTLTFDSVGHTCTRGAGSWLTDGFVNGMAVTFSGTTSNNGLAPGGVLTTLSATVMTFASGIVSEVAPAGANAQGSEGLTFAASGHTITRTAGSWITDGFAVGQSVTIAGTASNNTTATITVLTGTVMTFGSGLVNEGPIMSSIVTVSQNLTQSAWVAAQSAAFATIDADKRVDLAAGKARVQSPITGWSFRRPAAWATSVREYQHDVQIPAWRKADGPLDGWSLIDGNGNTVEFDERVFGGGLAARFTCLRSWANGPRGTFVALSLTRDTDGLLLSRTHNMAVADLAETVVQTETENAIGQVLQLNDNGTGTDASLSILEQRVNSALQINLLQQFSEGPRASKAVWTASRTDNLSTPGATLNGVLDLEINGTLEQIATRIVVS